jgi:3D (Asp-Asp-Asp) domain-containing protein
MPPRRLIGRAGLVLAVSAALLLPATSAADPVGGLRAKATDLAAREHWATLELYALDSRLDRARAELTEVQARVASVERRRASARNRLQTARRTLAVAERRLADQLRALYQQERPDPFEIMLGATSFQDAIDGLESLERAAGATADVVNQASAARANVSRLAHALRQRRRALESLRTAAAAREAELVQAQSARLAYLARLREEQRVNDQQIIVLQARARAAQARAEVATVKAKTAASAESFGAQAALSAPAPAAVEAAPAPAPAAAQAPVPARNGKRLTVVATAYSLPGHTASGLPVGPGIVAVDPTVIPMGTRIEVPGYGEAIAADVGSAIKGNRIDVWFPKLAQAKSWGAKTVTIALR